jgi:predicted nucleic acid-binding protein
LHADLPLGFADASVISCAERSGGAVLTLDRRDFDVVAAEGKIALVP